VPIDRGVFISLSKAVFSRFQVVSFSCNVWTHYSSSLGSQKHETNVWMHEDPMRKYAMFVRTEAGYIQTHIMGYMICIKRLWPSVTLWADNRKQEESRLFNDTSAIFNLLPTVHRKQDLVTSIWWRNILHHCSLMTVLKDVIDTVFLCSLNKNNCL
jgi:hypothetical protein